MKSPNLGEVKKTRYGLAITGREGRKAYQEALTRIGSTPEKKCRWWLRFAELNLKTLTNKEWVNLAEDVRALTIMPGRFPAAMYSDVGARCDQREIQQFLTSLRNGESLSIEVAFQKTFQFKEEELYIEQIMTKSVLVGVFGEILWAVHDKFRACDRCHKFFVATKRQAYCSATCSQTTRTSRYRAKARLGTSSQSGTSQTRKRGEAR